MAGVSFEELSRAVLLIKNKEIKEDDKSPEQKVIKEDELEEYLAEGWIYVGSLNNGSGKQNT